MPRLMKNTSLASSRTVTHSCSLLTRANSSPNEISMNMDMDECPWQILMNMYKSAYIIIIREHLFAKQCVYGGSWRMKRE